MLGGTSTKYIYFNQKVNLNNAINNKKVAQTVPGYTPYSKVARQKGGKTYLS